MQYSLQRFLPKLHVFGKFSAVKVVFGREFPQKTKKSVGMSFLTRILKNTFFWKKGKCTNCYEDYPYAFPKIIPFAMQFPLALRKVSLEWQVFFENDNANGHR